MDPILWIAAVVIWAVAFICMITKRQNDTFKQKFPPISDEEFMAHCKPGTNPKVALRVRQIVAQSLGIDYDRVYPSSRFIEDLGAD